MVVNNNAAATLLVLATLAVGREVIISRGELVEIGGGFRVPDVLSQSGATLREVGTTNRTRTADYAAAINERTGLILRVHPSNFRIEGFTARPPLAELVALAHRFNIPMAEDIGSGYFGPASFRTERPPDALGEEPIVQHSVAAGVDVVMFSGDKLLGGPQAGIAVGGETLIARVRTHPLMRALRVDKMTYAALEATLEEFAAGRAGETVPALRMIAMPAEEIGQRAAALAAALTACGVRATVVDGQSTIGGGSAPDSAIPTRIVTLTHPALSANELEERLRRHSTPVIARIVDNRVVIDLRTVAPEDDAVVAAAVDSGGN